MTVRRSLRKTYQPIGVRTDVIGSELQTTAFEEAKD